MPAYHANIRELAKDNPVFRRVLSTTEHCQLVVMTLEPHEDIGEESHDVDQVFLFISGAGEVVLDGRRSHVFADDIVVVPAGTVHNVVNSHTEMLRLLTLYAPPEHAPGTVHRTKSEAMQAELAG